MIPKPQLDALTDGVFAVAVLMGLLPRLRHCRT
jgi:hypothetical protein